MAKTNTLSLSVYVEISFLKIECLWERRQLSVWESGYIDIEIHR